MDKLPPTICGLPFGEGKKVAFLDFDGVLNTDPQTDAARSYDHPLFNPLTHMDRVRVARFFELALRFDLEVVISSTWREIYDLPTLRAFLYAMGFLDTDRVIAKTPYHRKMRDAPRHVQIVAWLTDRGLKRPSHFIILDDNPMASHAELAPFFVRTNPYNGFDEEAFQRAAKILSSPPGTTLPPC